MLPMAKSMSPRRPSQEILISFLETGFAGTQPADFKLRKKNSPQQAAEKPLEPAGRLASDANPAHGTWSTTR
jgi:hypothetical protein